LPGVESAGVAKMLPLGGSLVARSFTIGGQPQQRGDNFPVAIDQSVSHDYFRTMNIRLREGRYFDERDIADARSVVIVNEALVRRYFNGRSPLGKRLLIGETNTPHEIIGVTGNVKNKNLTEPIDPETYIPYTIGTGLSAGFVIKTKVADPAQLTAAVRTAIQAVDPDQPIYSVRTMEDLIYDNGAAPRMTTTLLSIFAALALVLASIGIYGVISYSVAQRTPEIGVRIALGAGRRDVLRLVIGNAMMPVGVGIIAGLIGSIALARVIASLLYGVSAYDPIVFGGMALLLGAIALGACYLPARRATRVDPVIVLRYE
jgi:putative ABC transport system permease protein